MKRDLTLARIRNTNFEELYEKFILNNDVSMLDIKKVLSIATIFLNSDNTHVRDFGYRIILMYCNRVEDYRPLYEIAINLGFIPVAKVIESSERLNQYPTFFSEFNAAYLENFHHNSIYRSEQQQELYDFFNNNNEASLSVIAPTSYGKTELILSFLKQNKNKKICILTPTKSLLAQTKIRILSEKIDWIDKVVIQPEMVNGDEKSLVAVLTQERLLRLLKLYPDLYFDFAIIDEAHDMLNDDDRNRLLASVIIFLEKRNSEIAFKFLTPFLCDSENLKIRFTDVSMSTYKVSEYIKSEKLYIYNERNDRKLLLYDQFIDKYYITNKYNYNDIEFIINKRGKNNIIYLNKPKDIEAFTTRFCEQLNDVQNTKILNACKNLMEFIHPQYQLLDCIKKGVIYHHGSVPDSVRIYIEHLFSTISDVKYVVTSSTLLEGVNLPADKLFILDNRKGQGYLSPSNFKNLIGRICRFSEVFRSNEKNLKKLEPEIYLIVSSYYRSDARIEEYLRKSMKVERTISDEIDNVLLEKTKLDEEGFIELKKAKEFIENYEVGTISNFNERRTKTEVGKLCFSNNITEIDIFKAEKLMQQKLDLYLERNIVINDTKELFNVLNDVFFQYVLDNDKNQNLLRFQHIETRNFYNMFLSWRIKNASYSEMIASFMRHWERLITEGKDTLVYVGRWGDTKRQGVKKLWTDIIKKTHKQKINLAIVRIKEEQDFLDNTIIKFIEILNDVSLLDESLYLKIKYGTDNKLKILLVKNGLSLGLSNLIIDKYLMYLKLDIEKNTIKYDPAVIDKMLENGENEILVYEMTYFIK